MDKVAYYENKLLEKIAATKWKHMWQGLSNKSKDTILTRVSDPNTLAEKSEDTLKSIAAKRGYKVYTSLDDYERATGLKSQNFITYPSKKIVVADKNKRISDMVQAGLPIDFAKRHAAKSQMHEAYETLSDDKRRFLRYGTHAEPGVMHRTSAYAARFPQIDRVIDKTIEKGNKVMDAEGVFAYTSGKNEQDKYRKLFKKSPSVYDDMNSYGVSFAESPVIDKKALRRHRKDFSLTNGIPMTNSEKEAKIKEIARKKALIKKYKLKS